MFGVELYYVLHLTPFSRALSAEDLVSYTSSLGAELSTLPPPPSLLHLAHGQHGRLHWA